MKLNSYNKIVIFSPHSDDVCFSMSAILNNWDKDKINIFTVFNKSSYTIGGNLNPKIVTKTRKQEDFKFYQKMNIKNISYLNFEDSSLRPDYKGNEASYMNKKNNEIKDTIYSDVKSKIDKIVKKYTSNSLYGFPLAVGSNIDHKILHSIGKGYFKNNIFFYEDVGYEALLKNDNILLSVKNIPGNLTKINFNNLSVDKKLELCKLYKTQIDDFTIKLIKNTYRKRNGENIWLTNYEEQ